MKGIKAELYALGLTQAALARSLNISGAAVAQLLNHDLWPKHVTTGELKQQIKRFMVARGADEDTLEAMFAGAEPGAGTTTAPQGSDINAPEEVMLLRRQGLFPETKKYFGLPRDPFNNEIRSHEDVFISRDMRYVGESMYQTARHGGLIAVISESGGGKSTLRRNLIDRLQREERFVTVIEPYVLGLEDNDIKGKTLKAGHISEAILAAVAPLEKPMRSTEARFRQVHRVLRDSSRVGNSHVLIIEEAHGLPVPTIKHLKRFFELEDGFKKLLSIILIGQSELRLKLSETSHEVREVVQRCEVVELGPLDEQVGEYLKFKFDRVGKPLSEVIDQSGIEALQNKLTISRNRRDRGESISLLYPLAVNNVVCAAMNLAGHIGAPYINADVIGRV